MNHATEFMPVECLCIPKALFFDKRYENLSVDEEPENNGKQTIHDKLNEIKQNGQQEGDHNKTSKNKDIDLG